MGLEELDLVVFEHRLLGWEQLLLVVRGLGAGVEDLPKHALDSGCFVFIDGGIPEAGLDALSDATGEDGGALAVVAFEPASGAGEVVVGDVMVVAGPIEQEPLPARLVDRACKVVIEPLWFIADNMVRPQDRLHPIGRLPDRERIVRSGVGDRTKRHDALVEGIGQDLVQPGRGERLRGERRCVPNGEVVGL